MIGTTSLDTTRRPAQRRTGTTSLDTTRRPAQREVLLLEETPPRLHASVIVLITTRRRRRTKTGTAPGTRATRTARREAPC